MSDIFVPPNLKQADDFLAILKDFLDSSARKRVEDDIVKFHTLNDGEAKKRAEAMELINKHSDILSETRKLNSDTEEKLKKLAKDKTQFKIEMDSEKIKLDHEKEAVKNEIEKAKRLNTEAIDIRNNVEGRESSLRAERIAIDKDKQKVIDDNKVLDTRKNEIEIYHENVKKLDNETRAKVEKLKQFNF